MWRSVVGRFVVVALLAVVVGGCARSETEERMFGWAQALQIHLTTDSEANYTVPERLSDLDPLLTTALVNEDGWGNAFSYRTLGDDRYQLISGGENGTVGDDDDVIVENGVLKAATDVYAQRPWNPQA